MTHNQIDKFFRSLFPAYYNSVEVWFPNGKNSIRVRLRGLPDEFIFTYINDKEWKFETVGNYLNDIKKGEKLK